VLDISIVFFDCQQQIKKIIRLGILLQWNEEWRSEILMKNNNFNFYANWHKCGKTSDKTK
jgi:hypothetical protein